MNRFVARTVGRQVAKRAQKSGLFDARLGFALMRSREVPVATKLLCLALGVVATMLIEAAELPLEAVLAAVLPVVGWVVDFAIDGLEFAILPFLIGSVLLTHLAPKNAVDHLRYLP